MRKKMTWNEKQHYSIRKYSFGAASVLIGASLLVGGHALADEQVAPVTMASEPTVEAVSTPNANTSDSSQTVESQEATPVTSTDKVVEQDKETLQDVPTESAVSTEDLTSPQSGEVAEAENTSSEAAPATDTLAEQLQESKVVTRASAATTVVSGGKNIAEQGYYTYPERTEVKNTPSATAPVAFYADAGDRVYYDKVLNQDGYQWISYTSYTGVRRYANIAKLTTQTAPTSQAYKVTGDLSIDNLTADGFDVVVTNASDTYGLKGVRVPVWTDNAGQDDIIWYTANNQGNGTYKATVKVSEHKGENGKYFVHLYYVENDGKAVGITSKEVVVPEPDNTYSETTLPSLERYNFDREVEVKNEPKTSAKTEFTFDKGDSVNYDKKLKADGYNWISYVAYSGQRRYIKLDALPATTSSATRVDSKPTGQISIENQTDKGFDIRISNVSDNNGILRVQVPVWTDNAGQDDLIWYTADKQSDGTYKVKVERSAHKNEYGTYNINLYYVENNGAMKGITAQQYKLSEPQVSRSGKLSFEDKEDGNFDIIISNVSDSQGLKEVKVPVWTEANGQDDLVWYTADKQSDGTYKVNVKRSDHKDEYGTYNANLYYLENSGQLVGITSQQHKTKQTQASRTGNLSFTNKDNGDFDVIVSNVSDSQGLKEVKVPVWTEANGQDDAIWYTANKQNDGTYKISVKRSDHKGEYGTYNIHLYYVETNGQLVGVTTGRNVTQQQDKVTGELHIQNQNSNGFDVVITNVSDTKGVREIKVPVWTNNAGQDDIVWYTANKQSDGNYKVTVRTSEHKGETGNYNVHLYYLENSGNLVGVSQAQTTVPTVSSSQSQGDYEKTLPSMQHYTFTKDVEVRNALSISAPVAFTSKAGDSVNYDKMMHKDGHDWISYVSRTGQRRYIVVD